MQRLLASLGSFASTPTPKPPPAGAVARFTGPLTTRMWRDDARVGDRDLVDWLVQELGGDPGEAGVRVEIVVRVLEEDGGPFGGSR